MLNLSSGGLTFYGGFLLATPVLIGYALWKKVPLLKGMDIVAPCLMVGLAFGRIGCYANGCCYGEECSLPWGAHFPYGSNAFVEQYEHG
jgi:phosphatidylglycerol:prolipoprotein diacylglycerol transferase